MALVARLVTLVDIDDDGADTRQMSVSARHEVVLIDGRRILLLDDRGWTSMPLVAAVESPDGEARQEDVSDIWRMTSVEDIENTARLVVGPEEPFAGGSQEAADADHWAYLAGVLGREGVMVDAVELKQLPHDVVLSERLLARLARD